MSKKNTKSSKGRKASKMLAGAVADAKARAARGRKAPKGARVPKGTRVSKGSAPATAKGTERAVDPRLPAAGAVIERSYKGQDLKVVVLPGGRFEFKNKDYRSLTAIAREVTGAKAISGPWFFGLAPRNPKGASAPAGESK